MHGVFTRSFAAALLLLTAACSSSGTVGKDNVPKPKAASTTATTEQPDNPADPTVCSTLTEQAYGHEADYKQSVATQQRPEILKGIAPLAADVIPLAHKAKGPVSFLVSALVIDVANDRMVADAGLVPVPNHNIFPAILSICGTHAANTKTVAICDNLEQDWVGAADAILAAKDDTHAVAAAVHKLADQAATDAAALEHAKDTHAIHVSVTVKGIKTLMGQEFDRSPTMFADNSAEQTAINLAGECADKEPLPLD